MSNLSENIDADFIGNVENSAIQATFHIAGFDKRAVNFDLEIAHLGPDQIHINTDKADLKPTTTTQSLEETIDSFLLSNINVNGSVHIGTAQLADTVLSGIKLTIQSDNNK
jgi:hypothetical protein